MELYLTEKLTEEPILKTNLWIQEAYQAGVGLAHAMNLSTVSFKNQPSSRMVLLKRISDTGLVFFTDFEGNKGQQILANNKVALNFWWAETNKQIRIEGECSKVSEKESDDYFKSRPRGSQISATVSKQSKVIKSYKHLTEEANCLETIMEGRDIERPKRWGGFIVKPYLIEFWEDQKNRLHKRELYTKILSNWKIETLSP